MEGLKIIVVENEAVVAEVIEEQLKWAGCQVLATTDSGKGAIEAAARLDPEIILMDVHLKDDPDGLQAAERLQRQRRVPVVFATSHSDRATQLRAEAAGGIGFVAKPFQLENFRATIRAAREQRQLSRRQ